jgi:hypothetical protein
MARDGNSCLEGVLKVKHFGSTEAHHSTIFMERKGCFPIQPDFIAKQQKQKTG